MSDQYCTKIETLCFRGRKHAKNKFSSVQLLNSSVAQGKEREPMLVSNYSTCDKKNTRFLKSKQKKQAEGLLSLLGIKQSFHNSGN